MRILKKVVRSITVFFGVALIIGGIFAASHEVHARSNGKTGVLSQVLTNPEGVFYGIKTGIVEISPEIAKILGRPQVVEVTPQKISTEEQPTPAAKPAQTKPPAQSAPQQPRRTNPTNQPRPQQQPVQTPRPTTPRPIEQPKSEVNQTHSQTIIPTTPKFTRAQLERYFPSGQIFFLDDVAKEVMRQTNQVRVRYGRGTIPVNSALIEAAKVKVKDIINYNHFDHFSPRLGGPVELTYRFMYPEPFANLETAIRSQTHHGQENLSQSWSRFVPRQEHIDDKRTGVEPARMIRHLKENTVPGFMRSPPHRGNILNDSTIMHGDDPRFTSEPWQHFGVAAGYAYRYTPITGDAGSGYKIETIRIVVMLFARSWAPYHVSTEEFLRLNPDFLSRVQQQGQ